MSDFQQPYAPIAELNVTDSNALDGGVQMKIPSAANFAADKDVMNYCKDELYGIITRVKSRRRLLEDEWLAIQRLRTLTHDGGQKYRGRSNVYMPTYATAHATLVSQLSKGLFPSDDYMDVESHDLEGEDAAQQVKSALKYELDCNAKLRQHIKPCLSQLVDHGNMVLKYWYRTGKEFKGKKLRGGEVEFKARPQKGLTVSARSIFNVVVYPETAEDEKDILVTAEYIDMDRNYALALANSNRWLNVDDALASANTSEVSQYSRDQSLLDVAKIPGMGENVDASDIDKPTAQQVTCIECYVSMRLPKSAYVQGEDSSLPIPARVVMFKGIPVEVTRNPHYNQEHPYLWARQGIVPGSFYGSWAGRRARYLQYLINDFANQTNDTGIYGLNPFMIVDTNLLTGPLQPLAPGRIFRTRDAKNAINFSHPPMEPIQYGQQLLSLYIGALMDNTGAPPVLQGVGRSSETATGQSILQRNSLSPLQDVVEDIESQLMVPLMERAWRLMVQYTDRPIIITDAMGMKKPVTLSDLDSFDYNFKFLSSSQAVNQQARAQQAMQMLQMLPPMMPLLQANGYMANPAPVFQKLHNDGFGWRQFDKFIFKLNPQQQMMMQQQAMAQQGGEQGAPAQGPMPQQPDVRGSEQNAPSGENAMNDPMATDDFGVTRTITDEINAMKGRAS